MDNEEFSDLVRRAIRNAGSAQNLAWEMNVSDRAVQYWASGRVRPSEERVERLREWAAGVLCCAPIPDGPARWRGRILALVSKHGSGVALAQALGVSVSALRVWIRRGRPSSAGKVLLARLEDGGWPQPEGCTP